VPKLGLLLASGSAPIISRDWQKAIERGLRLADDANSAESAYYAKQEKELHVVLRNGVKLCIPVRLIQQLANADEEQAANIVIEGDGNGLHWPELDLDMYVPSLAIGVYGTKAWMSSLKYKSSRPQT
jgi:hypothetical protein